MSSVIQPRPRTPSPPNMNSLPFMVVSTAMSILVACLRFFQFAYILLEEARPAYEQKMEEIMTIMLTRVYSTRPKDCGSPALAHLSSISQRSK